MKMLLIGITSEVEPLGMMYLAASLKLRGHSVDFQIFKNEMKVKEATLKNGYDFIGFSVLTGSHKSLKDLSLRYMEAGIKTVIGNAHATFFSEDCLNVANFVLVGEGINLINDIVENKVSEGKVFSPNLCDVNDMPMPDREIIYRDGERKNNPIKNVMTSFGCPFRCSYCYNDQYKKLYPGYKVRLRSVESVIDECGFLKKNYSLGMIFFQDDYFGFNIPWLEEFSRKYSEMIKIPFHCQMRVEGVMELRMGLLKKSGCHGITIAIESSNNRIRRRLLNRKMSDKQIWDACRLIKEKGFKLRTEQIIGLPESSIDDDIELLRWNCQIAPDIAWTSIYAPFRGTSLGEYCVKHGLYTGNNDDIADSFFDSTVLNFNKKHQNQINKLQRIFSLCAKIQDGHILAEKLIKLENLDINLLAKLLKNHLYNYGLYKI
ncbi:MAG: radical SAM protein [Patescibacteria group bacterium]|nr:radical SAM protein [Patescibacteria group bacterium]